MMAAKLIELGDSFISARAAQRYSIVKMMAVAIIQCGPTKIRSVTHI